MKPVVQTVALPSGPRVVSVRATHGHCAHLAGLLGRIGFGPGDTLVLVGDLIEKGPDSLKTLRYVMALCRRYNVYPVCGNCDRAILNLVEREDTAVYGQGLLAHLLRAARSLPRQMCDAPTKQPCAARCCRNTRRNLTFCADCRTFWTRDAMSLCMEARAPRTFPRWMPTAA